MRAAPGKPDYPRQEKEAGILVSLSLSFNHKQCPEAMSQRPRTQHYSSEKRLFLASSHLPHLHRNILISPTLLWKLMIPQRAQGLTIKCLQRASRQHRYVGHVNKRGSSRETHATPRLPDVFQNTGI